MEYLEEYLKISLEKFLRNLRRNSKISKRALKQLLEEPYEVSLGKFSKKHQVKSIEGFLKYSMEDSLNETLG